MVKKGKELKDEHIYIVDPFPKVFSGDLVSDTESKPDYTNKTNEISSIKEILFFVDPRVKVKITKTIDNNERDVMDTFYVRDLPIINGIYTLSFKSDGSKMLTVGRDEVLSIALNQTFGYTVRYRILLHKYQTLKVKKIREGEEA